MEPLGVGESLDAGFRLWRRHFLVFFLLSLLAVAPAQLLNAWYFTSNVQSVNELGEMLVIDPDSFLVGSLVVRLGGLLIQAIAWGALMNYGVNAYIGRSITVGDAARGALRRLLPFIGLSIIYFLMVGIGTLLLVIPGIWLGIRYILSYAAFYGEQTGPGQSLKRSSVLTEGRWWRIFALFFVAWLFTTIVSSVAAGLVFTVDLTASNITSFFYFSALVGTVLGALFTPLIPCMMIVAYYDGRIRKEGFDIEYMSSQLDAIQQWEADDQGGGLIR